MQPASAESKITIAVLVPNRNHGRFLPETLGSILRQTRQPDEVLIIDDGSTDDSVSVISKFVNDRPTWRLIKHPERAGVVRRLNEGLVELHSTWASLLGADDFIHPNYLERVERLATQNPTAGMICGCVEVFGATVRQTIRPPILPSLASEYISPSEFRDLLQVGDNYFLGTATLFRRETILEIGSFDENLGSICDGFASRQIAARHGFGFVPEICGYWRMHGQNFSVATVTDPKVLEAGIQVVRSTLGKEPGGIFPPGYADVLDRRLRFGGVRLIAMDRRAPARERAARIAALLHASRIEQSMLAALLSAGVAGSVAALAWLTLRLRPLSLLRLVRHMPVRRKILKAAMSPEEVAAQ